MIAALVELLGLPSLALAVGLYLPLSLTTPIMAGGAIRGILEKTYGGDDKDHGEKEELRDRRESGVLYASGMIAGAALIGVVAAGFIALSQAAGGPGVLGQIGSFSEGLLASLQSVGDGFRGLFGETGKDLVSITAFGALAASLVWVVFGKRDD
jgi:hypothetical protein